MRLVLLLLATLLLSACSVLDPDSSSVVVTGITVESIPEARPNGAPWDATSPPDIYLELQDALGNVYLSGGATDAASLPAATNADAAPSLNVERDYFVFAVEQDEDAPPSSWPWLGATSAFSFADVEEERPATLRVTSEGSEFCVVLSLDWD